MSMFTMLLLLQGSGDVYMISISSHYEDDQVAFRVLAHVSFPMINIVRIQSGQ